MRGKTNLNFISNKMAINWHKLQNRPDATLIQEHLIGHNSSNFDIIFFQNACFLKTNLMVTITKLYEL